MEKCKFCKQELPALTEEQMKEDSCIRRGFCNPMCMARDLEREQIEAQKEVITNTARIQNPFAAKG